MKLCGNCALWQQNKGLCPIFNMQLEESETGCPAFKSTIEPCEICGKIFLTPGVIELEGSEPHIYCDNCASQIHNCPTCIHSTNCAFETDPSPIPPYIMQTVRKGNTLIQTQVRNPERIRQICQDKCPCFSTDFECLRQFNSCGSWKAPWSEVTE